MGKSLWDAPSKRKAYRFSSASTYCNNCGCQQNETVETDTNVEEEQDHENDKGDETNSVSGLPSGEKVDFEGSNTELQSSDLDPKQLEVELEGEVFSTDDHIIIEGKNNLVPRAEISDIYSTNG